MAKPSVGSVWVNHVSTDPRDMVDRNAERRKLFNLLTGLVEAGTREEDARAA